MHVFLRTCTCVGVVNIGEGFDRIQTEVFQMNITKRFVTRTLSPVDEQPDCPEGQGRACIIADGEILCGCCDSAVVHTVV